MLLIVSYNGELLKQYLIDQSINFWSNICRLWQDKVVWSTVQLINFVYIFYVPINVKYKFNLE